MLIPAPCLFFFCQLGLWSTEAVLFFLICYLFFNYNCDITQHLITRLYPCFYFFILILSAQSVVHISHRWWLEDLPTGSVFLTVTVLMFSFNDIFNISQHKDENVSLITKQYDRLMWRPSVLIISPSILRNGWRKQRHYPWASATVALEMKPVHFVIITKLLLTIISTIYF